MCSIPLPRSRQLGCTQLLKLCPLQASCNFGLGDDPTSQSLLTSAVFAGMLLGAASWGLLADEIGRKRTLLASTAVVVAAGLASSAAPTPTVSVCAFCSALPCCAHQRLSCCCLAMLPANASTELTTASNAPPCLLPCSSMPQLLLLSRLCVGFGLAGAPVAFTLMMELLPASSRALWGVLIELAWTVGRGGCTGMGCA
jgi:MFS family permease